MCHWLFRAALGRWLVGRLAAAAANRLAAAAHGGVEQEGKVCGQGSNPHKGKHFDADVGLDVELVLGREGNLGGDADDGGDDGGDGEDETREAAEQGEEQREPPRPHDQRRAQQQHEVDDGAGHEEGVHDLGSDFEQPQDGQDLGGQGNLGAGEKLADENLDWVEPVECPGRRAIRDTAFGSG